MINGLHHITAIAGDPNENFEFYTKSLGLRLVKKSINQDAPDTYHLFYADGAGSPGTDLTFFPWPSMGPAKPGAGKAVEVTFAIENGSYAYWKKRLLGLNIETKEEKRFGNKHLVFSDPHGLNLAITETTDKRDFVAWEQSTVPEEHQIRWMHSVRTLVRDITNTELLLTRIMGFSEVGIDNGWHRYGTNDGSSGTLIDVFADPELSAGRWGTGGIHHIAWRVKDSDDEMKVRDLILKAGLTPSQQIDRFWFKSVYFQEPGGVLFEIATDGPGFDRDEDPGHLGEKLILPPWYENQREEIEQNLPELSIN
jgi:glyoxalase family protein